jgi:CheY-like chemotaxis protein
MLDRSPPLARILVAEDSPSIRMLLQHYLEHAGYAAELVDDGEAAVDRALAAWADGAPFHLILMDVRMPRLDGFAATARLRAAGFRTPIIAITAGARERDSWRAAGCDDLVPKPFDRDELLRPVRAALDRAAGDAMHAR